MLETLVQIPATKLVVGVDGGGSTTVAVVARRDHGVILGRGVAGPSNIQAVGVAAGLTAIDTAIEVAFNAAATPRTQVRAACLGLAGVDWQGGVDVIRGWAEKVHLASAVTIVNDSTLLLAAGTPEGWGLAVVCGTGSIAYARAPNGKEWRCGGWGYLLGDEGSGYQIALSALKSACRAFDRSGPPTALMDQLPQKMGLRDASAIIDAVYRGSWDRAAISGLAPVVLQAATGGDKIASNILRQEAAALARTAAGAVRNLDMQSQAVPVALTGGVILENQPYRELVLSALAAEGVSVEAIDLVDEPVNGAVTIARKLP